jgi:hypothetical protein
MRDQEGVGSGSQLFVTGNVYVSGTIYADTYTIKEITSIQIDHSGSTIFGDTADDTHQLTGSFEVSGQSNFSGDVLIRTDASAAPPNLALYSIGAAAAAAATDALKITGGTVLHNDAFTVLVPAAAGGLAGDVTATVMARTSMGSTPSANQIHWHLTGNDATKIANLKLAINGTSDDSKVKFGSSITNGATVGITGITATDGTAKATTYVNLTADTAGTAGNDIAIANTVGTVLVNGSALTAGTLAGGTAQSPSHAGAELDFRRYKDSSFAVDDNLGEVRFRGAESEGYHTTVNTAAVIIGEVGEGTWDDGVSHPGQIYIGVTSDGETTTTKRLVVTSTGLQVTGSLIVSGSTVLGSPGERTVDGAVHTTLPGPAPHDFTTFHNTLSGGVLDATTEYGLADVHANLVIVNDLWVSGSTKGVTINFGDELDPLPDAAADSAIWGAGDDFSIYHDGSNTLLLNASSGGHLIIKNESATSKIVLKTGTSTDATSVLVMDDANTPLWEVKGDGNSVLGTAGTEHQVTGSFSVQRLSGSGNASFAAAVDFAQDLTFNVDNDMGTVDFMIEDGEGPESALQLRKNGRVTKIGHDTPGNLQVLTWDQGSTSVVWGDGVIGISGSDEHYSSTELRTSGVLNVSGSATFGDGDDGSLVILPNGNLTALGDISGRDVTATRNAYVADALIHAPDSGGAGYTKIAFGTGVIDLSAGNVKMLGLLKGGGLDRVRINPDNADVDFIVSTTQSSGSLKIDGATGDIHFGGNAMVFDHSDCALRLRPMVDATSNQAKILLHSLDTDQDDEAQLQFLRYTDGSFANGDNLGTIQFRGSEDEDGTYYTAASIVAEVDEAGWTDGSSTSGRLLFYTTANGATTGTERMRIDDEGLVTLAGDIQIGGNDIKDSGGNVVISFNGAGAIDNNLKIQSNSARIKLVSDSGQSYIDLYGRGDAMADGDNVGALRFFGTEVDGDGAGYQMANILAEVADDNFSAASRGGKIRMRVCINQGTTLKDAITIDGGTNHGGYPYVGIGTTTPAAKLHIVDPIARGEGSLRVSVTDTGFAAYDTVLNLRSADSTMTSTSYWVKFYDSNSGATVGSINSEVAYSTFTGQHPTPLPSGSALQEGSIIASTGQLAYDGGLCNAWVATRVTTAAKDKAVVGVYRGMHVPAEDSFMREDQHVYNALGEGQVLVTDQNGNIETGDYICASDRAGYGMLQDDDLLHNYTVAKATTPVDFSTIGVDAELGFKSVLVPCTYHCG